MIFIQKHYVKIEKAQWREAANLVIAKHESNQKVYSNMEWWYNFYFYQTEPRIRVIGTFSSDEQAELQPFINEIRNERQFWVLSAEGMNGLNALQQQYVDNNFQVKESHAFHLSSAILYEREIKTSN
jgi:hypothetical protein